MMPHDFETDRELTAKFITGEMEAFDKLHRRYFAKVYRLAYLQTNNRDDAQDITAETFCRAFQRLHQYRFDAGDSIYPWLYRIAFNLSMDLCRDKAARQVFSLDAEMTCGLRTFLERIEDTKPSPLELIQQREVQMLVRSAISALSDDQREAVVHRFLGELSIKEIAETMRRSEGAVKSLIHRALDSLRDEILSRVSATERMQLLGETQESTDVRRDSIRIHRRIDEKG